MSDELQEQSGALTLWQREGPTRCRYNPPREQCAPARAAYNEWTLPNGQTWALFVRETDGYLLRFPQLADFHISTDGHSADCWPVPGVGEAVQQHLYLNQVSPLMLSRQGRLVFHASAVEVPGGAIAFLAPSGRGKSTLAAAFATAGHRFLTDDGLHLERGSGGFAAMPSHPSIRLWSDSQHALGAESAAVAPSLPFTPKARILAAARMPFCDRPRQLRAAYFLGEGQAREIEVGQLAGAQAMTAWVSHAFILDPDDRPGLGAHFDGVASLVAAVPCYSLDYPRRYEDLERIRRSILAHAGAARPPS